MGRSSVLVLVLAACGSVPHSELAQSAPIDDAVELASLLPDAMQACVVARPQRLESSRRTLVLLHSQAEPVAWERDLPVVAYASALAERPDGRRARRTYLRVAPGGREALRRALPVRWRGERCVGERCRLPVARWIDERTIEIARYAWPRQRLGLSNGECVALVRDELGALEVMAEVSASFDGLSLARPWPVHAVVRADARGLTSRRAIDFRDPRLARAIASQLRLLGPRTEPTLVPLGASEPRIERANGSVIVSESRRWEELELALEDERLRLRAIELDNRRNEPVPLARVTVENLAAVRHQVSLRRAELHRLPREARMDAARELADLLDRAWAVHPSEVWFARTLVRLALDDLAAPDRALAVIDRVLEGLPDPDGEWHLARREALAAMSERSLAEALIADRIAPRGEARRAAADLRALRAVGVSYEWAESAWRLSRELLADAPAQSARAQLPLEGALGALVGWAMLAGGVADNATIQIAVRSSSSGEARAIGESRPDLVAVRAPGGMVYVGGLASIDLLGLRRLGGLLAAHVRPGPIDVAIALRDPEGADLLRLRVAGRVVGNDLSIDRVAAPLIDVPWPFVARYLASPLAELSPALFPPPTFTIRTESAETAIELRRGLGPSQAACTVAGPLLRCTLGGSSIADLLLAIAADRLH